MMYTNKSMNGDADECMQGFLKRLQEEYFLMESDRLLVLNAEACIARGTCVVFMMSLFIALLPKIKSLAYYSPCSLPRPHTQRSLLLL